MTWRSGIETKAENAKSMNNRPTKYELQAVSYYTVSGKKDETKTFFCNIF